MIVDCHAHLVPPTFLEAALVQKANFPSVKFIEEHGSVAFAFAENKPTRPISPALSDVASRVQWLDANKIDRQVVGGWLDIFGYELPRDEGARWARLINGDLLKACKEQPRFIPLATVPLQDGALAAEVLREAHAQGFAGVVIGTQPKGRNSVLDDLSPSSFWQAAHDLQSVVFIHPVFESVDDRTDDYGMANAVGRVTDTLIAISRLIFANHVDRFNQVKIIVGLGGAALPYVVGRLRRNYHLNNELGDPDAALALMYYDTIVHDARALRYLVDVVGTQRIMMGSDMPFPIGDLTPLEIVRSALFTDVERKQIRGAVAARLFNL